MSDGTSKPISGDEIIRPDAFNKAQADADALLSTIEQIRLGYKDLGTDLKTSITKNPLKNSDDIKRQQQEVAALNVITQKSVELDIKKEKLLQQKLTTAKKQLDAEKALTKEIDNQTKAQEKANKAAKDADSTYRNNTKTLGALAFRVKENISNNRELSKTARLVAEAHAEMRAKVDTAEHAVGQFQRNVGNYPKQLKEMQRALQDLEPGTEEFIRLSKAAGEVKDKIQDAKDATKAFATESKGTQLKNIFGQIGNDIADLDFKGAAEKARTFAEVAKSITFAEMIGGIKNLGSAFMELATTLLSNPIFLIGATIAAVTAAVYAYSESLKDNSQAIEDNNKFIDETNKKLRDLVDSIKEHRRQILLTQGVITQSEYDIQVARSNAKKQDEEETIKLDNIKKQLRKDYGIDEMSSLEKILVATGLGVNTLIEKWKNYGDKLKQDEAASLIVRIGIRKDLEAAEKDIREKALAEDRKLNEEKLKEEKKAADERLKQKQDEWARILKENREFNAQIKRQSNEDLKKSSEDTQKENDRLLKEEDDKIKNRTAANTKELEESNAKRKKKEEEDAAQRKKDRQELENFLFDVAERAQKRRADLANQEIDREISTREKNIETQQRLAEKGLANTLVFEQAARDKALLAKEEQKKKEIRQQEALAFAKLVVSYAEKNPESALTKALAAVTQMKFIEGSFIKGTESVEKSLGRNKVHNGIDGYHIAVDGKERIMDPEDNALVGNMKNHDLAMLAHNYQNGLLPGYVMNPYSDITTTGTNMYASLSYQQLVELNGTIKDFTKTIANQPKDEIYWDTLGNMIKKTTENGMATVVKEIKSQPRLG